MILHLATGESQWTADEGKTWHKLMVGPKNLGTYYYPKAIQLADGQIVCIGHRGDDNAYGTFDQAIVQQTFRLKMQSGTDDHVQQNGLRDAVVDGQRELPPQRWQDFAKGRSASPIRVDQEEGAAAAAGQATDYWSVRHPTFTPCLLNAVGRPADIEFDPGIQQDCDIYLGLRAVDPIMTLAIKLSGESEFTTITAPAAASIRHFDFEFHWKSRVPMAGQKIVVRSLGKPLYLEHIRFVRYEKGQRSCRVPRDA